jgi:uncharacterized membrane protein
MHSRASLLGHPVHQQLVVFPLGLLATAVVFDVIHLVGGDAVMATVAYWMIVAGLLGGLAAAPFGWLDWRAIPRGARAKRIGLAHGATNAIVLALFGTSWLLRRDTPETPGLAAHLLAFAGAGLAAVGGWLGGELVARLGVGVHDGAHVDAPSSLGGRPASEHASRAAPAVTLSPRRERAEPGAGAAPRG